MDQAASLIGSKIGDYTVTDVLGQGAMGVVLYAQDQVTEREAAIKLLAPELASDDVSKERMAREAKALFSLKHPNIVSTYDFGSLENGRAYLVLEYVSGENLDDYLLKNDTLPVNVVINMAMQLANAMQFAHDAGIIHRDLKPQNIMLDQNHGSLSVKILDFGIAKMTADRRRLTKTGEVVGSPIFMSPEQCQGKKFDNRSDIYSLGIVLFKCLTGKYPHHGNTLRDTFMMKTTKDCPRIEEFVPKYDGPQRLAKLIYRCLEIKPKKRPATMADVYMELRQIADEANIVVDMRQSLKDSGVHFQTKAVSKGQSNNGNNQSANFNRSRNVGGNNSNSSDSKMRLLAALVGVITIICLVSFVAYFYLNKANVDSPKEAQIQTNTNQTSALENPSQTNQSKSSSKPSSFKTIRNSSESKPVKVQRTESNRKAVESPKPDVRSKVESLPVTSPAPPVVKKRKNYSPTKDEQHDAWWKYRLKKDN